jgi:transposase
VKFVEKQYGIKYSLSGMYDVLSRMRMSWVSARSIHPKTNIEKQEAFKKTLM